MLKLSFALLAVFVAAPAFASDALNSLTIELAGKYQDVVNLNIEVGHVASERSAASLVTMLEAVRMNFSQIDSDVKSALISDLKDMTGCELGSGRNIDAFVATLKDKGNAPIFNESSFTLKPELFGKCK